jgi:hypothetical protein
MKGGKNYLLNDCVMWRSWKNEEREWILEHEEKTTGIGNEKEESREIGQFSGCEKGSWRVPMLIAGLLFSFVPPISSEYGADFSSEPPIGVTLLPIAPHMNLN